MYAAYLGHSDTCDVLLKQLRMNVNDTNQMGQIALMLAASCGSAATVDTSTRRYIRSRILRLG